MWSYYGAKTNIIHLYPAPKHNKIIEPFAGTARYALRYFEKEVLLMDKYEVITDIWKWLQVCSPNDILKLPRIKEGENINDISFDCPQARLLMGFVIGFGFTTPRDLATPRARHRPNSQNYTLKRIASNLFKIRHWEIRSGSYEQIDNQVATWFIDPPYQDGGHAYKMSNKNISFEHLRQWSESRLGQTIVCEKVNATWMNFKPLTRQYTHNGNQSEGIWTNEPTHFDNEQLKIAI